MAAFSNLIISKYGIHVKRQISNISKTAKKLATLSCHISFLKCCRDHQLIPNGLRQKSKIKSPQADKILWKASMLLISERLNSHKKEFAQTKSYLTSNTDKISSVVNTHELGKVHLFISIAFAHTIRTMAETHKKKFTNLLSQEKFSHSINNPYTNLTLPVHLGRFSELVRISGILNTTKRQFIIKDNTESSVVNLSGEILSKEEIHLLDLGLNFVPSAKAIPFANFIAGIEHSAKKEAIDRANTIRAEAVAQLSKPSIFKSRFFLVHLNHMHKHTFEVFL